MVNQDAARIPIGDGAARLRYLDGLRGLAALVVFITHLSIVTFPAVHSGVPAMSHLAYEWHLAGTPLDLLWAGNFAVCIFFVMSGLVLAFFYERDQGGFVAACVRRYVRLTVPIFVVSSVAYVIWAGGAMHSQQAEAIAQEGWLKLFYAGSPKFQSFLKESLYGVYLTPRSSFNSSLWTMTYEFWGSVSVFLLYAMVRNPAMRIAAMIAALVLFDGTYFMCFAGGTLLYEWSKPGHDWRRHIPIPVAWVCLIAGAYMGAFPYPTNIPMADNIWFNHLLFFDIEQWHRIGALLLIFAIVNLVTVQNFLCRPALRYLGRISFALYLIHVPLICSLTSFLILHFYWPPHLTRTMLLADLVTVPVAFGLAHATHVLIDTPGVRLSRHLGRLVSNRLAASQRSIRSAA
jgi:peptidoglycan/LPS O-acetylase OafA/YrhL